MVDMRRCAKCGAPNPLRLTHCFNCKNPLSSAPPIAPVSPGEASSVKIPIGGGLVVAIETTVGPIPYPFPEEKIAKEPPTDMPIGEQIAAYRSAAAVGETPAGASALAAFCRDSSETPQSHMSDLYREMGELETNAEEYAAAEADLKRAIQLDPRSTPAYCSLAKCYKKQKKMAEGKAMLRAALTVRRTDSIHKSIIRDWLLEFD